MQEVLGAFATRLSQRLDEAQAAVERRSADNERAMREREQAHARVEADVEPIHRELVRPMLEELARRFDNASLEHFKAPRGFLTHCRFAHTARFPAIAKLVVGLEWEEESRRAWLAYELEILPLLLSFNGRDRLEILPTAPDRPAIRAWLERKLLEFVDTYLEVENSPHYQQGSLRTDPVCGMQVSAGTDSLVMELEGKTYSFCSGLCFAKFAASPGLYTTGKAAVRKEGTP
ncbi:MAG: YHS domain-containing protein [Dehalococcoidia bacterium]|nr:YHS domain-containing protein [Dehalococcoidia bacterium]